MKVLFVYRGAEWLGVEILSAVLQKKGHRTGLLFHPGFGDVEIQSAFLENVFNIDDHLLLMANHASPDLICFSMVTNLYPWASKLGARIKKMLDVPIIAGGIHPTVAYERILSKKIFDAVCVGEGEEAICDVVEAIEQKKSLEGIRNILTPQGELKDPISLRPLIQDLDALPFPDKEPFYRAGCFKERLYVMTGRGCPFNCTYCFNRQYRQLNAPGKYIRRRSVESVVDEIKYFLLKYPIKEIFFYDDIFSLDIQWLERFSEIYRKQIALPFKALVHPQTISAEMAALLAQAGCVRVDIGLESGSERVRQEILERKVPNQTIIDACRALMDQGIEVCTLNVIGIPGETEQELEQTFSLNKLIKPNGIIVSTLYPFPGTVIFQKAIAEGYLPGHQVEKVLDGEGGYKEGTPLRLPHSKAVIAMQTWMPIWLASPDWLLPLLKRMPPNRFIRWLSVFFLSTRTNRKLRIKETLRMNWISLRRIRKLIDPFID